MEITTLFLVLFIFEKPAIVEELNLFDVLASQNLHILHTLIWKVIFFMIYDIQEMYSLILNTILQDSLGGNAKTIIIANISPSSW